jgi:hypothetical protein
MAVQPTSAWRYPVRAVADAALILLGILLATWPLVLVYVLLRVIL